MNLLIDNFAKIKHANIEFNGITVIAGDNNTGKSTIGKILFALFDAFNDINQKIKDERNEAIRRAIASEINSFINGKGTFHNIFIVPNHLKKGHIIIDDIDNLNIDNLIETILGEELQDLSFEERNILKNNIINRLGKIKKISDCDLKVQIIGDYFKSLFNSQVNSLFLGIKENTSAIVELNIKDKTIKGVFSNGFCEKIEQNINLLNKAVYIDDPFIVDTIMGKNIVPDFLLGADGRFEINRCLKKYLRQRKRGHLVERILAEKQLEEINARLKHVVRGEFIFSDRGEIALKNDTFIDAINISNLSTGIKAFVILKKLLEDDVLKNKDVLVLDEPEIHLHPEWQIIYAELIVLLQKFFDLTILLTTHSPYFLRAIDVFAVKYGVRDKCKFYLSANDPKDNFAYFVDKTDKIDSLFKKMADAFAILNNIDDANNDSMK